MKKNEEMGKFPGMISYKERQEKDRQLKGLEKRCEEFLGMGKEEEEKDEEEEEGEGI